jgi:hypothetical protein
MGEFVREDFVIEIAHGRGYLLYCNPEEKRRVVSCSVMVLSVHGNSNTEEDQQKMRETTGRLRNGKNKEEAAKRYLYDHKEIIKK